MFLNLAIITGFLFFTFYFVYKFVRNDFKGLDVADEEKNKTDKLFKILNEIIDRLPEKDRDFVVKNGEDFALQYFDLKAKELEKERKRENKLKNFYFFSAIKLEGELIFLINYFKVKKDLIEKMKGIQIPDEYYSIASEWENSCKKYFSH
ncbi:hypothetical protein TTHT_1574 [Thermotomaculum hydrothermale]|uniref:Uncharacterized protein n=1 Tax=Thermotomaculum hydrothermale TaxID=981385 RepID=A0A7R6PPS9_9BACT|nr:hypothetical protein [Thermotomaculum hydrothermale]BBB33066.1 hypothetical protein TTHT_1574 [Thermotomaculum hydrothermale]